MSKKIVVAHWDDAADRYLDQRLDWTVVRNQAQEFEGEYAEALAQHFTEGAKQVSDSVWEEVGIKPLGCTIDTK